MMEIGCDRSDERDGEQRQRQRSRSPPGSKEGGCYQGESKTLPVFGITSD
jgi:hypothetical protein